MVISSDSKGNVVTVYGRQVERNVLGAITPVKDIKSWEADLVIGCDGINGKDGHHWQRNIRKPQI